MNKAIVEKSYSLYNSQMEVTVITYDPFTSLYLIEYSTSVQEWLPASAFVGGI